MARALNTFVEVFLLKTAFLGGIWSAIELNPQKYVVLQTIRILQPYLEGPFLPMDLIAVTELAFILVFVAALVGSATFGSPKGLGLVAFVFAFVSGYLALSAAMVAAFLLFVAVGLALVLDTSSPEHAPPHPPI